MPRVAIVGSGLIGRAWAMVFSRAGWDAAMYDSVDGVAETALGLVAEGLDELAEHGLVDDPKGAAARVRAAESVADALDGVSFVQENVPETLDAKRAIFAELDQLAAPDAILASSSSAIVASCFTENLKGRARCLVAHPVNPPHLVPIVELVGAPWTSPRDDRAGERGLRVRSSRCRSWCAGRSTASSSTACKARCSPRRFVWSARGMCRRRTSTRRIKDGLGLRWSFMGPFATIELNAPGGIADYCARYTGFYKRLQAKPAEVGVFEDDNVARILKEWGKQATPLSWPQRTRWRDQRLAALAAHKKGQPEG